MIEKKDAVPSDMNNHGLVFLGSMLKAKATEVREIGSSNLYLRIEDNDGEPFKVDYALMEFSYSECNDDLDEQIYYKHVFSGTGFASMREMRHTYFGDDLDGYCFYLPGKTVIRALEILQEYFDMD